MREDQFHPFGPKRALEKFRAKFLKNNPLFHIDSRIGVPRYMITILPVQIFLGGVYGLIAAFTILPIFTYHIFLLLFNFTWLNLGGLIMIYFIDVTASYIGLCLASSNENSKLLKYLAELKNAGIKLEEYALSDFITNPNTIHELSNFYPNDESKNPENIWKLYYLHKPKKIISGGFKAFTVTNYPNPKNAPKYKEIFLSEFKLPRAYIFSRYKPKDLNYFENFSILHEIGHTTDDSKDAEEKAYHHQICIFLFPILFFFVYGYQSIIPFIFLIPYSIIVIYGTYSRIAKIKIEHYCDSIAIHLMDIRSDFDSLLKDLIFLFSNDKKRRDNIKLSIQKKKDGLNVYSTAILHIYPEKILITSTSILVLLISIYFFEGSLENLFLVPVMVVVLGIITSTYFIYQQAIRLSKIESELDNLQYHSA